MERDDRILTVLNQEPFFILDLTEDLSSTIQWLRDQQLLPSNLISPCCESRCRLVRHWALKDREIFECSVERCELQYSIRTGTIWNIFSKTRLVILVRIVFFYFLQRNNPLQVKRAMEYEGYFIKLQTIRKLYQHIRKRISNYMNREVFSLRLLQGYIQMQKIKFSHRITGTRKKHAYIIGMLEVSSRRAFAVVVPSCSSARINDIIRRFTQTGSLIITDEWLGYRNIPHPWIHVIQDGSLSFNIREVSELCQQLKMTIEKNASYFEENLKPYVIEQLWWRKVGLAQEDSQRELTSILSRY